MSCEYGHVPHMTDDQLAQAVHAYERAAYSQAFGTRMQQQGWVPGAGDQELPARDKPRRTTSLAEAHPGDKVGAIDVEYVRVR